MNLTYKSKNFNKIKSDIQMNQSVVATDLDDLIYKSSEQVNNFDCSKFKSRRLQDVETYRKSVKIHFFSYHFKEAIEKEEMSEEEDDDKKKKIEVKEEEPVDNKTREL